MRGEERERVTEERVILTNKTVPLPGKPLHWNRPGKCVVVTLPCRHGEPTVCVLLLWSQFLPLCTRTKLKQYQCRHLSAKISTQECTHTHVGTWKAHRIQHFSTSFLLSKSPPPPPFFFFSISLKTSPNNTKTRLNACQSCLVNCNIFPALNIICTAMYTLGRSVHVLDCKFSHTSLSKVHLHISHTHKHVLTVTHTHTHTHTWHTYSISVWEDELSVWGKWRRGHQSAETWTR